MSLAISKIFNKKTQTEISLEPERVIESILKQSHEVM